MELSDYGYTSDVKVLESPILDGTNQTLLRENMIASGDFSEFATDSIMANACSAIKYFARENQENNLSKVLCLGKVQSGKTAFFIATIALAFDNGYRVVCLLGGTKNKLRDQNFERVEGQFSNNPNVTVYDLNSSSIEDMNNDLADGKSIIVVALKNVSGKRTNLNKLNDFLSQNLNVNTVIVDDEGDEVSPGAPATVAKGKTTGTATHDKISNIVYAPKCCTFLSVTATPQANLLLPQMDRLSPDYVVLVYPGDGYTGGREFHDNPQNPHMVEIMDSEDFEESIPLSFKECFYYFIFGCCLQLAKGSDKPYSMLVHPSSYKSIHKDVLQKIDSFLNNIISCLSNKRDLAYKDALNEVKERYYSYLEENENCNISFDAIEEQIPFVLGQLKTILMNSDSDVDYLKVEEKYKIFIGGNVLGRGITIKNLFVTYIYRDNKGKTAIDTLYQRARWFGYKSSYFDICKVYLTRSLIDKFVATVANEDDMWNIIQSFLLTDSDAKLLPRVFRLDNDDLKLTRNTVSKTVELPRMNPGYSFDNSVWYSEDEINSNRELFKRFFSEWKEMGKAESFNTTIQTHYVIKMRWTEFVREFLNDYILPKGSVYSKIIFDDITNQIIGGFDEDVVRIVVMRYKTGQYRQLFETGRAIKLLPQGRDDKTGYAGDRYLPELMDQFHIQIHLVYTDKNNPQGFVPVLALNNPFSQFRASRYVTGEFWT